MTFSTSNQQRVYNYRFSEAIKCNKSIPCCTRCSSKGWLGFNIWIVRMRSSCESQSKRGFTHITNTPGSIMSCLRRDNSSSLYQAFFTQVYINKSWQFQSLKSSHLLMEDNIWVMEDNVWVMRDNTLLLNKFSVTYSCRKKADRYT